MEAQSSLDMIRRRALDRVDTAQSRFKWALLATAFLEAALLVVVLLVTDFQDPVQKQVFFCIMLVYFTLAMALVALGAFVARVEARLLKSVELLAAGDDPESDG